MNYNDLIRDKLQDVRIETSAGTWEKVEKSLDDRMNRKTRIRKMYLKMAAAAAVILLAFFVGKYQPTVERYQLETVEIFSHQGSDHAPLKDLYQNSTPHTYRKNGKLIPNYRMLWDRPLMPRERSL